MIFDSLEVGPLVVNCFILGCEETREGVIIDAGGNAEEIIAGVEWRGLTIVHIINTHGHFDHIGANRALKEHYGADLMIHADDVPMMGRDTDAAKVYCIPGEKFPHPDTFLTNDMEITFGKQRITVLHTPGHTLGGCCLYMDAEKKILTGDTLFANSVGRTDLPGGSYGQLLDSVHTRLFTLPDDVVVYPGHGPKTTIGYEKRHNPYC